MILSLFLPLKSYRTKQRFTPETPHFLTVTRFKISVKLYSHCTQGICSAPTLCIMTTVCHCKPSGIHIKHRRDLKTSTFIRCTKREEAVKDTASSWHTFFLREEGGEWKLRSTEKTRCQCMESRQKETDGPFLRKALQLVQLWGIFSQVQGT